MRTKEKRLIDKFAEEILSEESFSVKDRNENFFFVQCTIVNAKYIYMKNSYKDNDCDSDISQTMKLVAIKSNGTTYIIDEYTFRITREENLPKGVMKFSSFVREKNEFLQSVIFRRFYDALAVCKIEKNDIARCKKEAREILLSKKSCVKPRKIHSKFTEQEIADSLCEKMDLEVEAENRLNADKTFWLKEKAYDVQLKEFVKNQEGVELYELKIADAIRSVEAKMFTVEFKTNGKKATGKIDAKTLQRKLIGDDYFDSFSFDTINHGKQILNTLDAGESKWDCDGKELLDCKKISKISYGKKVLYKRETEI